LDITVHPYCWDKARVRFTQNDEIFDGAQLSQTFSVRCRCFGVDSNVGAVTTEPVEVGGERRSPPEIGRPEGGKAEMDPRFPKLRLRFFQKLDAVQRLRVLDDLGLIPKGASSIPNMTFERMVLESLQSDKRKVDRLEAAIQEQQRLSGGETSA
jgi:hypothetical protein